MCDLKTTANRWDEFISFQCTIGEVFNFSYNKVLSFCVCVLYGTVFVKLLYLCIVLDILQ